MTLAAIPPRANARRRSLKRIVVLIPNYSSRQKLGSNRAKIRVCTGCEPIPSTTTTSSPISAETGIEPVSGNLIYKHLPQKASITKIVLFTKHKRTDTYGWLLTLDTFNDKTEFFRPGLGPSGKPREDRMG